MGVTIIKINNTCSVWKYYSYRSLTRISGKAAPRAIAEYKVAYLGCGNHRHIKITVCFVSPWNNAYAISYWRTIIYRNLKIIAIATWKCHTVVESNIKVLQTFTCCCRHLNKSACWNCLRWYACCSGHSYFTFIIIICASLHHCSTGAWCLHFYGSSLCWRE